MIPPRKLHVIESVANKIQFRLSVGVFIGIELWHYRKFSSSDLDGWSWDCWLFLLLVVVCWVSPLAVVKFRRYPQLCEIARDVESIVSFIWNKKCTVEVIVISGSEVSYSIFW